MKIKTALCSFGTSGKFFHAPFIYNHPGFDLYAVVERTNKQAKEKYPNIISYNSFYELINDAAVDVVIINTPNITHFEYATMALHANKHVIVEKPFTTTVKEAQALITLAKEKNKLLTVYHNRRYDSDFLTVQDIVIKKVLGEIHEARFCFDRYKPELSNKIHKETPGVGSGILFDLGSHLIDQTIQLFGLPNAVFADIGKQRTNSKIDDYFDLKLYYKKSSVSLHSSLLVKENNIGYILHGTNGSFIKPKTNIQEEFLLQNLLPTLHNFGAESEFDFGVLNATINNKLVREKVPSVTGNYMQFYTSMYNAIINQAPLPVSAEEAMQVIQIIEAAYISNRERRVIELSTS
ncbi:MAG TPA: Gfo/Idh/MocA family oxidoreductase [Chitinophagaceae bacterium]|nr:Gfo/Idh/MocA family oxidoreductase [Chitinophagaceae bacterium]HMZ47294.1 Gfo/Idh/MocA family oxidoreductase [Chitinophagaceae bacterium]HNF29005.1 Gfo/Idh/MocA family oxidoreductase [Chitinophagaceae bacterium]HNJ58421.1 Gfo/Idh/MocA family oxidoreductase [Chitinophagaceae bacterium]HNL82405.1 Gfo/Idh/MocA family oxidoreductase [Chitinophagaceae bacterium]